VTTVLVRYALITTLLAVTACGASAPTSPGAAPTPTPPAAIPAPVFPPPSGPSRLFAFDHESDYRVSDYTRESRFVLYDNGAFVLQYGGRGEYRGAYTDSNGSLTFDWEGSSVAGPWRATGTLAATQLTVRYNGVMQVSDFENAVYALVP
jgi:hypothetical protein